MAMASLIGDSQEMSSRRILHEFFVSGTLTDVVLMTSVKQFSAHKVILAAESGFLRARLTTGDGMTPQTQVDLDSISGDIMALLLDYIYLRKLDLTDENVREIYKAADYLIMDPVIKLCVEYFKSRTTNDTCFTILPFAREYSIRDLTEFVINHMLKNFEAISKNSDFLNLDIGDLVILFKSDHLNVRSEETVWETLVAWYEHNPEERRKYLSQGLRHIRLGVMDTQYFLDNIRDNPDAANCAECRPIIVQALRFFFDLDYTAPGVPAIAVDIASPRYPSEIVLAVGGWSGGSPTSCIETYDVRADRWTILGDTDPEGPRSYHGTVVIGSDVYVIGGYNGHHYFYSCRCFNLKTRTWRPIPNMNKARCYVSVAVVDEWIYAIGGFDGFTRLHTAERFDTRNGTVWMNIPSMANPRSDASASVINGNIYVAGGFTGRECLQSVEVYDTVNERWRTLPSMESRRSGVSCIAHGNCLYVLGGFNGQSRLESVEKYDPKTDRWTSVASMLRARSNFAVAILEGNIMVIGGFNGTSVTSDVEYYEPSTNLWTACTSMTVQRSALSACTIKDIPDVTHFIYRPQIQALEYPEEEEEAGGTIPVAPPLADVPMENIAAQRSRMLFNVRHA